MEYLSEPDIRILGGIDNIRKVYLSTKADSLDPLTHINDEDLDTYEKRQKVIDEYCSYNGLRRTSSYHVDLSKFIIAGLLEHEARKLRYKNKRKFEE